MRLNLCALIAVLSLVFAACGEEDERSSIGSGQAPPADTAAQETPPAEEADKPKVEVPDEKATKLETDDIKKGDGTAAKKGDTVSVNYVGVSQSTGKEFDTSYGGEPFEFELGGGQVIKGWDQGVEGMKEGGRRRLVIPAKLGYGKAGQPPDIKPNETLVFVIDLLEVR